MLMVDDDDDESGPDFLAEVGVEDEAGRSRRRLCEFTIYGFLNFLCIAPPAVYLVRCCVPGAFSSRVTTGCTRVPFSATNNNTQHTLLGFSAPCPCPLLAALRLL
jgi:hypothetical protein